jgi:hypothetical protein
MKTYIALNKHVILFVILLFVVLGIVLIGYTNYISESISVIPSCLPDESNRIFFTVDGYNRFSIISPSDWFTTMGFYITLSSHRNISNSSQALGRMFIKGDISLEQEDIEKIQTLPTITFQNTIAYVKNEVIVPRKMFGSSGYYYEISFERNKKWYFLSYLTNRKQKQFPPPIILEYFNTFRLEDDTESVKKND